MQLLKKLSGTLGRMLTWASNDFDRELDQYMRLEFGYGHNNYRKERETMYG